MFDYDEVYSCLLSDLETYSDSGFIASDSFATIADIRAHSLRNSFYKKLSPVGNNATADLKAFEKFEAINDRMAKMTDYVPESEVDSLLMDYFKDNFQKALDFDVSDVNFDLAFMRDHFGVGPGAALGANSESFYTKVFESKLSATSDYLVALYRAVISESDSWSFAEKQRFNKFGFDIVRGSRLFFVPKNSEISRTCCTEPSLNMMFQKALGAFLEYRLGKSFGISLKTQPDRNRELARIGSLDGSFGTIDLASASDSIAWRLMQRFCPGNLLGYFRQFRCEFTTNPRGEEMRLGMISTMGNGFTFPLQTIIFASAVRAVYQLKGLTSSCSRTEFGVFGDDIVVRASAYNAVVRLLQNLGFEVNVDKSFNTGPFRESCGHDYYSGGFVRGVYIKSLEARSDVFSAINRLNKWSAISGISLPSTIRCLTKTTGLKLLVPPSESEDCGIQVPFKLTLPKVTSNYWFAYRKSIKVPRKRAVPIDEAGSRALGYVDFNPYGWLVTTLGGYARRTDRGYYPGQDGLLDPACLEDHVSWLTLRHFPGDSFRFKVVRCSIPYWDWAGSVEVEFGRDLWSEQPHSDGWKQPEVSFKPFYTHGVWEDAVGGNLS